MAQAPRTNQVGVQAGPVQGGYRPMSEQPLAGNETARALQQAGQQVSNAGGVLTDHVIREQSIANDTEVSTVATSFSRQVNERWSEFAALQGRHATEAFPRFQEGLAALREETLAGASNPVVRRGLELRVAQMSEGILLQARARNTQQLQAGQLAAAQGLASEAVNNAVRDRNTPELLDRAIGHGVETLQRTWRSQGLPEEAIRANAAAYRGEAYSRVIDSMINTDPMGAQALFGRVRDTMDAAAQIRMEDRLQGPVMQQEGYNRLMRIVRPSEGGNVPDRIWRGEGGAAQNPNPGQTAQGGGVTRGAWNTYAPRLGFQQDVEGQPPPPNRRSREAFDAIYPLYMADARTAIGRDLNAGEQYAAWVLGIQGAKAFLMAGPDADAQTVYRQVAGDNIANQAFRYNGNLMRPGMTTGQVLTAIAARVSGPERTYTQTERPALVQRVMEAAGDDPRMQAVMMSQFGMWWNAIEQQQSQEREALTSRITSTVAPALALGDPNATIPEADIYRLLPGPRAQQLIDELRVQQLGGQITRSINFASPQQVAEMRADLVNGNGPITSMLRQRTGTRLNEDGTVNPEDHNADITRRAAIRALVDQRVERRETDSKADPAAFARLDPNVARLWQAAQADPSAWPAYIAATTAVQARIGRNEDEQRVLDTSQIQSIIRGITTVDPAAGTAEAPDAPSLRMRRYQTAFGEAWPRVFRDLVRGGMPREYQILANIPTPAGQADFARMMSVMREAGGADTFRSNVRRGNPSAVEQVQRDLGTKVAAFNRTATASGQTGGQELAASISRGVENLALYYVSQGTSASEALDRAQARVIGDAYEIEGTMRVPRRLPNGQPMSMSLVQRAQSVVMRELRPEQIADVPNRVPGLAPSYDRQVVYDAAQRGYWVPNENDTGAILMMDLRDGGRTFVPVTEANPNARPYRGGHRLEIFYDRLPVPSADITPRNDTFRRLVRPIEGFGENPPAAPGARPAQPAPAAIPPATPARRNSGRWEPPQ
jgi:hypothetical protein